MPQIVSQQPSGQGPADVCTKGRSCGVACIDKDKECLKNLSWRARRVARRIAAILKKHRKLGPGGETKDASFDKGLTKVLSALRKSQENLGKAVKHRKKICKKDGKNSATCKKAKEAEERAKQDRDTLIINANRVASELEGYTKAKKKRQWSQEEIDNAIKHKDAHNDIQQRIGVAIDKLEAREKQIEATYNPAIDPDGYRNAKRQAFGEYLNDLDAAYDEHYQNYPNSPRKNPNDIYMPDEFAEGVYEMLPAPVRNNLKNTGSLPENEGTDSQGIIKLHKGKNDFDADDYYTGETGEVIAQDRAEKYGKKGRGVAMVDGWLRNDGKSIISDTRLDLRDQQGEHFNDHSKHKRGAETYGNLAPGGAAENMEKKDKTMDGYVEDSLVTRDAQGNITATKSAQQANAAKSANNSKTAQEAARVSASLDAADDGVSRANEVRKQFDNDASSHSKFVKKMKETIAANPNDSDLQKLANKSDQDLLDDYQAGKFPGSAQDKADFVAAWSVNGTGEKARRTYRVVSDRAKTEPKLPDGRTDALTTDIKKSPRGTIPLGKTTEARVVAAAYALGTDNQRRQIREINRDVIDNESKPRNNEPVGDMYIKPMQDRLNQGGTNPTTGEDNPDFSWFPR